MKSTQPVLGSDCIRVEDRQTQAAGVDEIAHKDVLQIPDMCMLKASQDIPSWYIGTRVRGHKHATTPRFPPKHRRDDRSKHTIQNIVLYSSALESTVGTIKD